MQRTCSQSPKTFDTQPSLIGTTNRMHTPTVRQPTDPQCSVTSIRAQTIRYPATRPWMRHGWVLRALTVSHCDVDHPAGGTWPQADSDSSQPAKAGAGSRHQRTAVCLWGQLAAWPQCTGEFRLGLGLWIGLSGEKAVYSEADIAPASWVQEDVLWNLLKLKSTVSACRNRTMLVSHVS